MKMPQIRRKWKHKKIILLIPGGWQALVPQVMEDSLEVFTKAWSEYLYNSKMCKSQFEARKRAKKMIQNVFNYAWSILLSQAIFYWAKEYAKRYPERLTPTEEKDIFVLEGFNAEKMQYAFVPGQKPGRGLKFVDEMLREMNDAS